MYILYTDYIFALEKFIVKMSIYFQIYVSIVFPFQL